MIDLFAWADQRDKDVAERMAATVIDFETEFLRRRPIASRFELYVQHERRMLARAAGAMPPAPILPLRRQA